MATRTIAVRLKAETADFSRQLKSASKSLEDVAAKSDKTGKVAQTSLGRMVQSAQLQKEAWSTVSTGLLATGAAAGAMVGVAVKKFADFDEAMSSVQAATHESAANMEMLRAAAISAGADTQYSATEAAGAIEELAKAGISTADILNGGLAGALNLAAAGGLEVGQAAEIAATALTQFKLKGSDVGHVADLLAAGAGKAQGDVSDLGMALKQSGLVASQTGLSIEETTGALSAFASAGLLGSDAGTSFKSMLQRLTPQSKEAQTLMDELGISAYDAQGNFVGLANFAGNLQGSLQNLTTEQRNSALATIFGSDAVRAASVFYEQGEAGIQGWIDAVDDSGYAAETAAAKTDNLKGDIERLGGSLETAFIKAGSGANGALRGLVQGVDGAVDAFGRLPEPVQQGVVWLGALVGAGAGVTGLGMTMIPKVLEMTTAMRDLGMVSGTTAGQIGKAAGAIGKLAGQAALLYAAGQAVGFFVDKLQGIDEPRGLSQTTAALVSLNDADLDNLFQFDTWDTDSITGMSQALDRLLSDGIDDKLHRIGSSITGVFGAPGPIGRARDAFDEMDQSLAQLVAGGNADMASQAFRKVQDAAAAQGIDVSKVADLFPTYRAALQDVATQSELTAGSQGSATGALQGATSAMEDQASALHELIKAQSEAAGNALSLSDAQMGYESALQAATDAIAENGQTLDITTDAGRKNRSALDDIASSGWDLISSLDAVGTSQEDMQASMGRTREDFIATAVQMGMNQAEAEALADSYGLIPDSIKTTADLDDRASGPLGQLKQRIVSMPDKTVTVYANDQASFRIDSIKQKIQQLDGSWATVGVQTLTVGGGKSAIVGSGLADGGILKAFANGGENHIAQIARAGEMRLWAEPETGGEAYIPLAQSKRNRSLDILSNVAETFGYGLHKYASGGMAVPREARVTPSYMSQPNVSVSAPSMEGLALTGSLNINGVLVPLVDARIERQQKRFARGTR